MAVAGKAGARGAIYVTPDTFLPLFFSLASTLKVFSLDYLVDHTALVNQAILIHKGITESDSFDLVALPADQELVDYAKQPDTEFFLINAKKAAKDIGLVPDSVKAKFARTWQQSKDKAALMDQMTWAFVEERYTEMVKAVKDEDGNWLPVARLEELGGKCGAFFTMMPWSRVISQVSPSVSFFVCFLPPIWTLPFLLV